MKPGRPDPIELMKQRAAESWFDRLPRPMQFALVPVALLITGVAVYWLYVGLGWLVSSTWKGVFG